MTSDASTSESATASFSAGSEKEVDSGRSLLWNVLAALASPKLTTVLVVAAIVIVLFGTLAQVYMDIWEVVNDYFRAWIAWIEWKVLFPPAFFPWATHVEWEAMKVKGFPFPGGALIGLALVINLVAAHAVRFKMQARGLRLGLGLLVLAAGAVTTWLVIETGHNRQGLQGQPLLAWSTLWLLIQIGLVAVWITCLFALGYVVLRVKRKRTVELVVLGSCTLGLGLLLVWLFSKGGTGVLNDSSMRILYNLIQGEIAALVLLAASAVLFSKRAGIVLLHGGLGLMMFGEFFVSYFAEEQQMTLTEGQAVNYTRDIRSVELAITTESENRDSVMFVATKINGKATRYVRGGSVPLDGLPFDVEFLNYFKNSTMRGIGPDESNLATKGPGLQFVAEESPAVSGTAGGRIDYASAYIRILGKTEGENLGTYLVSQHFSSQGMTNSVSVGDETFRLDLRFKRSYKPYQITLMDVRKDDYVGTTMARNYSSQVKLKDSKRNVEFETKIWMNNPLRYAGETFYQSGYNVDRRGREYSNLQVVKNTGWMIPYVSCMIVATGMLAHFLLLLFRFLRRIQQRDSTDETGETIDYALPLSPSPAGQVPVMLRWLVPLAVVALGAVYVAGKAIPGRPPDSQMQLDQFGSLPLMYQGRVKPFDTLARNSLRVLSNRETFVDVRGQKQPAIRWLLDVIARPDLAKEHRVLRIDNLEVLKSLGLERRRGFRYAWAELESKALGFDRQVMDAQKQPPEQRTLQQRRILELGQRVERYRLLSDSFRPLQLPPFPSKEAIESKDEEAMKSVAEVTRRLREIPAIKKTLTARQPPLAVPVASPEEPWWTYAAAANQAYMTKQMMKKEPPPALAKLTNILEGYQKGKIVAFNRAVADYKTFLADNPPAGLDLRMTGFEAYFNHLAPFYHAIPLYILALVLTPLAWLSALAWPRLATLMRSSTFWLIVFVFAIHTFALAARVAISGRPPVTNLYSSAVFVGWGCVALGLLLEWLFRLGIGNLAASVTGIGSLIVAHFLAADGDTIRVLQAVLDTQFWLTVHVLTVTLGYSATFLAGLLGLVLACFVFGKTVVLFAVNYLARRYGSGWLSGDWLSEVERILGAMIFGTVCFAAFFSLVGTVLGGLWADDSWGRFWGWDPKENGALIVVLWNALVLHARGARMVKERGLALLAIGGNIVTAWSWFGVNELGVGLHSYGFTEGAARTLWLFWISQLVIIGFGVLAFSMKSIFFRRPIPVEASS